MSRATMAVTLLACLAFTVGCSNSDPEAVATTPGTGSTIVGSGPAETATPLDGLSALEVWKRTRTAAAGSTSVHVAARLIDGRQRIALNLKTTDSGKAVGTLILNGNQISVRRLGGTLYFKADRGFWTANADAATAAILANKWIMVKKGFSADMEQFFQLTDMNFLLHDALSLTASEQKGLQRVAGIDVGRQPTVGLADPTPGGTGTGDDVQTLYVSNADPALPMTFTLDADSTQYMKFRGWNQDFTVVAPAGAIDLAKVG